MPQNEKAGAAVAAPDRLVLPREGEEISNMTRRLGDFGALISRAFQDSAPNLCDRPARYSVRTRGGSSDPAEQASVAGPPRGKVRQQLARRCYLAPRK
jgi:hypothetical protein